MKIRTIKKIIPCPNGYIDFYFGKEATISYNPIYIKLFEQDEGCLMHVDYSLEGKSLKKYFSEEKYEDLEKILAESLKRKSEDTLQNFLNAPFITPKALRV